MNRTAAVARRAFFIFPSPSRFDSPPAAHLGHHALTCNAIKCDCAVRTCEPHAVCCIPFAQSVSNHSSTEQIRPVAARHEAVHCLLARDNRVIMQSGHYVRLLNTPCGATERQLSNACGENGKANGTSITFSCNDSSVAANWCDVLRRVSCTTS